MNESFISRDILFLEQNRIQSEMSKYVEWIHQINGYYKQPNYNQRIHKKEYQKSLILLPNFQVLSKKFEDHTKQIEDKVIKEWMEKLEFEEKFNPSNTVSMDYIMKFLKNMVSDFNNMILHQQMPDDNQKENKPKLSQFEKDFMMKQIDDNKINIILFTTLIQQISKVLDYEQIVSEKNKEFIKNLLEKYLQIIQISSEEIVFKSEKLMSEEQHQVLNKNIKNSLLHRLLEIEQKFINLDSKNYMGNASMIEYDTKINQIEYTQSINYKDDGIKSSSNTMYTGHSINAFTQNKREHNIDISISSHKEIEYLDFLMKDSRVEENSQKEIEKKFKHLMERLSKLGDLIKLAQTEKIHEMIEMINEFKTVLFLHNLLIKNRIENFLKAEENMNLYEKKELKKKIEQYRTIIQKSFQYLDEKKKISLKEEKPTFKRYMGDQGMITHKHLILNKDNLVPIFKHLDPSRFHEDHLVKKFDIKHRQEEQMQKHIQRIQKTNQSFSICSQPTSTVRRNDTVRSNDLSILSKIQSRQNSLWSKYDDTSNSNPTNLQKSMHSSKLIEDPQKLIQEKQRKILSKFNSNYGNKQFTKDKDKTKEFTQILKQNCQKRKGLQEYEQQKNSKQVQQHINQLINNSFDEDKVNEQILNRDLESQKIIKQQNKFPQILLNMRNTFNSNQFNISKSDDNSMAELSQENLPTSMNDLSVGELSPNSNFCKQNEEILIRVGDKQISPIKPNQRIRGVNRNKIQNYNQINNTFHFQSVNSRCSSSELGGNSVDYYQVVQKNPRSKKKYQNLSKNESYEEHQDGSTLFTSQQSPFKSQEQSFDYSIRNEKSISNKKQIQNNSMDDIQDMVSKRQRQRLLINRMQLPNTLPIMNSLNSQSEYQQQQQQQQLLQKEQACTMSVQKQVSKQSQNIKIHVKEFQFGEKTLNDTQQTIKKQQTQESMKQSINFYDTMYQYKLKVERQEIENQERLNKRQKVIDNINSHFMPKYIHINGGKLAQKANPHLIRNLVNNFRKEELEKNQYVLQNYQKLKKKEETDYYGIEELTCPPKEHKFITSTIQNTYEDIKTDNILFQNKQE
ncbi:hypothetical protein TTHERM_00355340 (macronuclear) [Tetrahymena thermophila SB210]|uniref:Uncharacterized protein n=1 Tax=Tetrahymena thermophila (strain SB210) TaxID=312017 RepID=Q22Y37_TETTS|nr:hypothetical protein TTHERM_00355340 [Tetrahymena thermophila SB210]EAR90187.2 hypothetical protein TTHERM_00355340 [Tetrahymena thermophila SB210]|eukprot:XP_001010432.2 hypothetical protein TTHERM_00355340 [Tetrahymena thermophila SB210]